jgi:hypothetical protein
MKNNGLHFSPSLRVVYKNIVIKLSCLGQNRFLYYSSKYSSSWLNCKPTEDDRYLKSVSGKRVFRSFSILWRDFNIYGVFSLFFVSVIASFLSSHLPTLYCYLL